MKTIKIEQLKDVLIMRKTHFEYQNKDSTTEHVYGTLQYSYIPESMYAKNSDEEPGFKYYDLYENDWRYLPEYVTEVNVLSQ
jgi:hypothetical protein